jgi:hypothetical protein
MPSSASRALAALVLSTAMVAAAGAATIIETFSAFPLERCFQDGERVGSWLFAFNGFGCVAAVSVNGNTLLAERPAESTSEYETHAALAVGPSASGDVSVQASLITTRQLRLGTAPNAWEVAWLLWHFADNTHFYYFIPKPNGWELGKADPAYPGAQRFLATGTWPVFPVGTWNRVSITQVGQTIDVSVNGELLTRFTDRERTYTSGRVGLYTEDAESYFDDVSVTTTQKGKKK